jgi:hypothetical protein
MADYNFDRMHLNVRQTRQAIDSPALLHGAFIWSETPQGEDYWRAQTTAPTHEGRSTLAYMAAQSIELEIQSEFYRGFAA